MSFSPIILNPVPATYTMERLEEDFINGQFNVPTQEGMLDTIKDLVPSAISVFTEQINKFFKADQHKERTHKEVSDFVLKVKQVDYGKLRNIAVQIPPGFIGDYASYYEKFLLPRAQFLAKHTDKDLTQFKADIGRGVNRPEEFLKSLRTAQTEHAQLTKLKRDADRYFNDRNNAGNARYGVVYKRNNDWDKILQNEREVIKLMNKIDVKRVIDDVSKISSNLSIINQWIHDNYDNGTVSRQAVQFLGEKTFYIASLLEMLSNMNYLLMVSYNCTTNNINTVLHVTAN